MEPQEIHRVGNSLNDLSLLAPVDEQWHADFKKGATHQKVLAARWSWEKIKKREKKGEEKFLLHHLRVTDTYNLSRKKSFKISIMKAQLCTVQN